MARTKYILLGDYDFIFSESFERDISKLADKILIINPKTVLAFRIFEAVGSGLRYILL